MAENYEVLNERVNNIKATQDEHKDHINRIYDLIDKVRNRLPVWATLLISILVGLLGVALGVATK